MFRYLMNGDAGRSFEGNGHGVTVPGQALHPEFHIGRLHAEFVLKHAACPQRGGLLVFGNADTPSLQIGGLQNSGIAAHQDAGMKEAACRENRDSDPAVIGACTRHSLRAGRQFTKEQVC